MARRNRSSQVKRDREQKKRERQRRKVEKAAQKRERKFGAEGEDGAERLATDADSVEPPADNSAEPASW